ncbi:MAG TPA: hypothetical protein VFF29_03095 [Bacteroidota bacterium]|nr:hypothetical protein [Bacteroidota bacterium]
MDVSAKITGIKYTPLICRELETFEISNLQKSFPRIGTFLLKIEGKEFAVSWWTSAKRTRTYPYARVYNSLSFHGKKVTIIPIYKDEGLDGDRDYLQWDTVSLMSLLGIYTIISYYRDAAKSKKYKNKIASQRFDLNHISGELRRLLSYQSDSLHWNLDQINRVGKICQMALNAYSTTSKRLGVKMHSKKSAEERIKELLKGKENFMSLSRRLAHDAQRRESLTKQPKESLTGEKATITIKNYLGGYYYLTVDEIKIRGNEIELIEGKHSKKSLLPALSDIKDGLVKMMLFTNLKDVRTEKDRYKHRSILKLTSDVQLSRQSFTENIKQKLKAILQESQTNGFVVTLNGVMLQDMVTEA